MGVRCKELGVSISIHPEIGTMLSKEKEIDLFLKKTEREFIGLTADVGFLSNANISPTRFFEKFIDSITHVQFKDIKINKIDPNSTSGRQKSKREVTELGKGRINLKKCSQILVDNDYSGWIVIETGQTKNPKRTCEKNHKYAKNELDIVLE